MSVDYHAVVIGEASETDSDDEISLPPPSVRPQQGSSNSSKVGAVVQGEASETDSDAEDQQLPSGPISGRQGPESLSIHGDLPPLRVETISSPTDAPSSPDTTSISSLSLSTKEGLGTPKYDTLIHHNLRDKNAALLINIHSAVGRSLNDASKVVFSANQLMHKSQIVIQDVCQLIRNSNKDLDLVIQKVDIINTTRYIPNIRIPSASSAGVESS